VTAPARPDAGRRGRASRFLAGAVFAGFEIRGPLGEGGMGAVYRAHDPRLSRDIALKVLPGDESDDEARARFLREAKALARVDHENVVRVYSSGVDEGVAWMSLALIEGDALDSVLADEPLDEETALLLAASCARGLAAVHREGVVHRDVKPANILIDENGQLHIVDFGIAAFTDVERGGFKTREGLAVGTPHYMSPEQARGGSVDARADAWGLGATLYAMLAGAPPFFHTSEEADIDILARVLRDRAPDLRARAPHVSTATADLVRTLLDPDRDGRPADLDEVAATLDSIVESLGSVDDAASPEARAKAGVSSEKALASTSRSSSTTVVDARPRVEPPSVQVGAASDAAAQVGAIPAPSRSLSLLVGILVLFLVSVGVALVVVGVDRARRDEVRVDTPGGRDELQRIGGASPVDVTPLRIGPANVTTDVNEPVAQPLADPLVELAERIRTGEKGSVDAARTLVAREDEAARDLAKVLVVEVNASSIVMAAVVDVRPPHAVEILSTALESSERMVAERAVDALIGIRPIEAIELLNDAASTHPVHEVRARARDARKTLFSVEGE
jgi:serine/threonine protein kinase